MLSKKNNHSCMMFNLTSKICSDCACDRRNNTVRVPKAKVIDMTEHTKIRDPNSREAKLITGWQKCCPPNDKDAPIPQHYINGFIDGYGQRITSLEQQLAESEKQNREMMAGLLKYGEHLDNCRLFVSDLPCNCGFEQAICAAGVKC